MPVEDQILQIGTYLQIDLYKRMQQFILLNERDSNAS